MVSVRISLGLVALMLAATPAAARAAAPIEGVWRVTSLGATGEVRVTATGGGTFRGVVTKAPAGQACYTVGFVLWPRITGSGLRYTGPAPLPPACAPGQQLNVTAEWRLSSARAGTVCTTVQLPQGLPPGVPKPPPTCNTMVKVSGAAGPPRREPRGGSQRTTATRVGAKRVSGRVLVRRPGARNFTPLPAAGSVPFGSTVDVTRGKVRLSSVPVRGRSQTTDFSGGVVRVSRAGPVVEVALTGGDFSVCRAPRAAQARRNVRVRRVLGSGKGKFGTRGRNGSARTGGTVWVTEDFCDGTRFTVRSGSITVFDRALRKRVVVRAGRSYLAKDPAFRALAPAASVARAAAPTPVARAAAACQNADLQPSAANAAQWRQAVICQINLQRAALGLRQWCPTRP